MQKGKSSLQVQQINALVLRNDSGFSTTVIIWSQDNGYICS